MKKNLSVILLYIAVTVFGQIGIGTSQPHESAMLEINSNSKGLLPPRLTTAQRDNIPGKVGGVMIYNTDLNCMQYWNTVSWSGDCNNTPEPGEGTVTVLDCTNASHNGTLTVGIPASGVNSVIAYTGGNGGTHNGQTVASTGVAGLAATLSAGSFANGNGNLTYTITGTPLGAGTASFAINIGGQTCTLSRIVNVLSPSVGSLNCASATFSPSTIEAAIAYLGTMTVPYTGGNGGSYPEGPAQVINGLTFKLQAGTLNIGSGNLVYSVTGTPTTVSTMSIPISFNGATSCSVSKAVQFPVTPPPDGPYDWIQYNSNTTKDFTTASNLLGVTGTVSQRTPVPYIDCAVQIREIFNQMSAGTTTTWKFNKLLGLSNVVITTTVGAASNSIPTFWRNGVQVFPTQTKNYIQQNCPDPNLKGHTLQYNGAWFNEIRLTSDKASIIYIGLGIPSP